MANTLHRVTLALLNDADAELACLVRPVALIERHMLGGDCLHTGCVSSKALIGSARLVREIKRAVSLGVPPPALCPSTSRP